MACAPTAVLREQRGHARTHLEVVDGVGEHGQEVQVVVHDHVRHVAVDEQLSGLQPLPGPSARSVGRSVPSVDSIRRPIRPPTFMIKKRKKNETKREANKRTKKRGTIKHALGILDQAR